MIVTIVTIIILVLIGFTSGDRQNLSQMEGILGSVFGPVQRVLYSGATSISDFIKDIQKRGESVHLVKEMEEKLRVLEQDNLRLRELERENRRLKALLDFKQDNQGWVVTGARVIGKSPGNWFNMLAVDKGSNDGVQQNMTVVSQNGLVGRVVEVSTTWSKVLAIVDGRSSVSAIVERTRDNGVVRGNNTLVFEDGLCTMYYLPDDSEVIPGDKVITSGLGGVFPKGIYIGEVTEVVKEKQNLFKYAVIKPAVDFQRIEEVLIVKSGIDVIEME
ncbi:MAG TPA: rod shape-determining protein MreC [Clostridiales bacterium]|nr:rod shape-determining protein MreC [Clostridiales bacterium]